MLCDYADHRRCVWLIAGVRSHASSHLGGFAIGTARHQRRNCRRISTTLVGVVGQATRHEQRAEVCVPKAKLAERLRILLDFRRWVRGITNSDLLSKEHDINRVLKRLDIELA